VTHTFAALGLRTSYERHEGGPFGCGSKSPRLDRVDGDVKRWSGVLLLRLWVKFLRGGDVGATIIAVARSARRR
jgi:hypothetical protein